MMGNCKSHRVHKTFLEMYHWLARRKQYLWTMIWRYGSHWIHSHFLLWPIQACVIFFSRNVPHIKLPSESTLRKTSLTNVFNDVRLKVADELSHIGCLNLMFDGWTDRHNKRHFMGIRACYIREDWTSNVITVSCKPCPQDADGIYEHIKRNLKLLAWSWTHFWTVVNYYLLHMMGQA